MKLSAATTLAAAALMMGSLFLAVGTAAAAAAAASPGHLRIRVDDEEPEAVGVTRVTPLSIPGKIFPSQYRHDEVVRKLQGDSPTCADLATYLAMDTCDCSGLDSSTMTGALTCSLELDGFGFMKLSIVYSSETDFVTSTSFYLSQEDEVPLFSYDFVFQGAMLESCAATIGACQCECAVGMCPGATEASITGVSCPGFPGMATCTGDGNTNTNEALAVYADDVDECYEIGTNYTLPPDGNYTMGNYTMGSNATEAPTMEGTDAGTAEATSEATSEATEVGVDTSVQRDGNPFE